MNKKTIKHSLIVSLLIFVLLASSYCVSSSSEKINKSTSSLRNGRTLLMGTIVNPVEEEGMWTAQAFQVFYYQPGIFFNQGGVVKRLTTITFSNDPFIQVWTPGPFEMIGYVFGITSEFEIIEK